MATSTVCVVVSGLTLLSIPQHSYLIAGDCDTECGQEQGEAEELCPLVAGILLVNRRRRQRNESFQRVRSHPVFVSVAFGLSIGGGVKYCYSFSS